MTFYDYQCMNLICLIAGDRHFRRFPSLKKDQKTFSGWQTIEKADFKIEGQINYGGENASE